MECHRGPSLRDAGKVHVLKKTYGEDMTGGGERNRSINCIEWIEKEKIFDKSINQIKIIEAKKTPEKMEKMDLLGE